MDDLEGVLDDANSHQFLAVVASVHHERVGETFNDGTLSLAETLDGETTSRVWQITRILLLDGNVVLQQDYAKVYFQIPTFHAPIMLFIYSFIRTCNDMSET